MWFEFEYGALAKPRGKQAVVCAAVFVTLFSLMFVMFPGTVLAKAEYAAPPTELAIKLNDGSGNVTTLATYTVEQLKQMTQVEQTYSSVDSMPAPNFTAARGVLLRDLLAKANVDINTVERFYFTATDDYRLSLTKQFLLDTPRYYYPKICTCWDEGNSLEGITYKPGVEEGKTRVEPVVAIESYQARCFGAIETTDRPRFDLMDGKTAFRLFFGQANAGELINDKFVRWMNGIEIVRPAAAPPPVSGSVMLDAPPAGQIYHPGDWIAISGKAQYMAEVTVSVTAPGGQIIHSATDPDAKSGGFSAGFALDAGAETGDYRIKISGTGLPGEHTTVFQVAKASGSVVLTTPAEGGAFRPGDKVAISGTAQNMEIVTVCVTDPDGQTIHSAVDPDAKSGSFATQFTLDGDAPDGNYGIKISGAGLAGDHMATFLVAKASGGVVLTVPAEGSVFRPGDKVAISGTAQNLESVTVNVTGPGGQTVYSAGDLDAKSGSFGAWFTLGAGAAEGEYSVRVSGAGLAGDHMAAFRVSRLGGSVILTTLAAGQVYQPGDKVAIGGTAQNLATVTVHVTDPAGQIVYSASELDAKNGGFSAGFTLAAGAAAGDYSIKVSGAGIAHDYIMPFKVAGSTPAQGFLDLDRHWAQKEINELAAIGALKGVTETKFMPDACVTRAQFAAMLVRVLDVDPRQGPARAFQDVTPGAWYYDPVGAAVEAGLVSGYSSDVFGPDDPISREQMTAMIARATLMEQNLEKPSQEAAAAILQKFEDENTISDWAKAEVALAVREGIIRGKQGNSFSPQEAATRAEAAVIISRLPNILKLTVGEEAHE